MTELAKLGGTFFLAFGPLILITAVLFGGVYAVRTPALDCIQRSLSTLSAPALIGSQPSVFVYRLAAIALLRSRIAQARSGTTAGCMASLQAQAALAQ